MVVEVKELRRRRSTNRSVLENWWNKKLLMRLASKVRSFFLSTWAINMHKYALSTRERKVCVFQSVAEIAMKLAK